MWDERVLHHLNEMREKSRQGGGEKRVAKQHALGKLTARERLAILFDENTFTEVDSLVESRAVQFGMEEKAIPGDGVVIGYGKIGGRLAFAFAEDFTVIGGTLGEAHAMKICRIMDMAFDSKAPLIGIYDSGGARIEEGIDSLNGYSGIFRRNTRASGVIPQIAVMMGPCAGGACYSPAICDFIFMTEQTSQMFITGPKVVKSVTAEATTAAELGGAKAQIAKSGVAHFRYADDRECLTGVPAFLQYLPSNHTECAPFVADSEKTDDSERISSIIPDAPKRAYDVHQVIECFTDRGSFFEIQKEYACNIVIGLCRINGEVTGIVANQPSVMAGVLDINASDKAARFIRFCDCFHIPLVTLVDTPGYLPGTEQEHAGIIRHGAKMLYAYSEATVPKISVILRKAFGGAYIAMNSRGMGADAVYALPIAQIAVMGAEGAVDIMYRNEIAADPAKREHYIAEYEQYFMNPYIAASRGYIDEVIDPAELKRYIGSSLEIFRSKEKNAPFKKHGNIPL